jgi:hypothetical protein
MRALLSAQCRTSCERDGVIWRRWTIFAVRICLIKYPDKGSFESLYLLSRAAGLTWCHKRLQRSTGGRENVL